jgi:hypothetical protein
MPRTVVFAVSLKRYAAKAESAATVKERRTGAALNGKVAVPATLILTKTVITG